MTVSVDDIINMTGGAFHSVFLLENVLDEKRRELKTRGLLLLLLLLQGKYLVVVLLLHESHVCEWEALHHVQNYEHHALYCTPHSPPLSEVHR